MLPTIFCHQPYGNKSPLAGRLGLPAANSGFALCGLFGSLENLS